MSLIVDTSNYLTNTISHTKHEVRHNAELNTRLGVNIQMLIKCQFSRNHKFSVKGQGITN